MSNRNISLILPALTPDFDFESGELTTPMLEGVILPLGKRRLVAESQKQMMAIEAIKGKSFYGIRKIAEMDQYAQEAFKETAEFIVRSREQVQGDNSQTYVDEFSHYLVQMSAQQIIGVVKVGSASIAREIARSPYPPDEPRTIWQRLFGD